MPVDDLRHDHHPGSRPIERLLIANRGEIVARVARTAHRLGMTAIGVYSEPDATSPVLDLLDEAHALGGTTAAESYLDIPALLDAAHRSGADAVHPGFGFLAEHADFARSVLDAGLTWIGPPPDQIEAMGDKVRAKHLAQAAGVPVLPTFEFPDGRLTDTDLGAVSFPLLVKAAGGGGGRGMRLVHSLDELDDAVAAASREAASSFGDPTVYAEPYLSPTRHIEVQIVGDAHGNVLHFHERECSIQRRHQKIVEEAPSAGIDDDLRADLCHAAVDLAASTGYQGVGTVEFLVAPQGWAFVEMNARLQVEHPVTEAICGVDLVELQLAVAEGQELTIDQDLIDVEGHAIEVRLYAEDPAAGWAPSTGRLHCVESGWVDDIRYEIGVTSGSVITPWYDPMIAKLICHRDDRDTAARSLAAELRTLTVHGVTTNAAFLAATLASDDFLDAATTTGFCDEHRHLLTATVAPADHTAHLAALLWARQAEHRRTDRHWGFAPSGWRNGPADDRTVALVAPGRGDDPVTVSYRVDGSTLELTVPVLASDHDPTPPVPSASGAPGAEAAGDLVVEVADAAVRHRVAVLEHRAESRPDGPEVATTVTLEIDRRRHVVNVHRHGDDWWINSPAGQTAWRELPRFVDLDAELAAGGPTAPVPGRVATVEVEAGDRVDIGTVLVVMEAMKMEHSVTASGPAVVTEVLVAVGDQVDAGTVLVRLDAAALP